MFESLGPTLGVVVGSIFFLLLSFAALTSTISLLEVPTAFLVDEKHIERKKATWLVAVAIFVIGIPSLLGAGASEFFASFITLPGSDSALSFMSFVGLLGGSTFLSLGGFFISIFAAYVWRKKNFNAEIQAENESTLTRYLRAYVNFAIGIICPLVLGAISLITILSSYFGLDISL